MAVVRFNLPAASLRVAADACRRVAQDYPPEAATRLLGAAKEFSRAATRPGLTAELTYHEVKVVLEAAPWPNDIWQVLAAADERVSAVQAMEDARPRGAELGMAPHRSFHARREAKLKKKDAKRQ